MSYCPSDGKSGLILIGIKMKLATDIYGSIHSRQLISVIKSIGTIVLIAHMFSHIGKMGMVRILIGTKVANRVVVSALDISTSMVALQNISGGIRSKDLMNTVRSILVLGLISRVFSMIGKTFVTTIIGVKIAKLVISDIRIILLELRVLSNSIAETNLSILIVQMKQLIRIVGLFVVFVYSMSTIGLTLPLAFASLIGFTLLVGMAIVVLITVKKITAGGFDKDTGIPNSCKPLLLIAGSFLLFSLSILILGLSNNITMMSMIGFIVIVGVALGTILLLSKLNKSITVGLIALLMIAFDFLAFVGVIAVMSLIAGRVNFLGLLGIVGIITLMVGVGVLAGLASGLLVVAGIGLGALALGIAAVVGSMALIVLLAKAIGDPNDTIRPFTDALAVLITGICAINPLNLVGSILIGAGLVVVMLEMLVVFTLLRIISKLALTSEENTKLTQSMNSAFTGIKTVVDTVSSIKERNLAVAVAKSIQIRLMMCNVSAVMRILSKIASRKVPVKWDKEGNVTEWEQLDDTNVTKITSIVKTMVQQVDGIAKELMKEGSLDAKALRSAKRRARAMKNMMRHVSKC